MNNLSVYNFTDFICMFLLGLGRLSLASIEDVQLCLVKIPLPRDFNQTPLDVCNRGQTSLIILHSTPWYILLTKTQNVSSNPLFYAQTYMNALAPDTDGLFCVDKDDALVGGRVKDTVEAGMVSDGSGLSSGVEVVLLLKKKSHMQRGILLHNRLLCNTHYMSIKKTSSCKLQNVATRCFLIDM